MANQKLGSYTFEWDPEKWPIPKPEKFFGKVLTYSSAGFFSFGVSIVGKEIVLEWEWMSLTQWANLVAMYEADTSYIWDPRTGTTYLVEILGCDGEYFEIVDIDFAYRQRVKLTLMIMEAIVGS